MLIVLDIRCSFYIITIVIMFIYRNCINMTTMKYLILITFAFIFLSCLETSENVKFSDDEYSLLAYDQILINYHIPASHKDSLYNILFNHYSVSRNKLDSLKSILVKRGPYQPLLLERVKSEIDSIDNSNIFWEN